MGFNFFYRRNPKLPSIKGTLTPKDFSKYSKDEILAFLEHSIDDHAITLEAHQELAEDYGDMVHLVNFLIKKIPYSVLIEEDIHEILDWCYENLHSFDYEILFNNEKLVITINEEKDRILFKMKWGNVGE